MTGSRGRTSSGVGPMAVAMVAILAAGAGGVSAQDSGAQVAELGGPEAAAVRDREIAFARTMADRDFEAFRSFLAQDAIFFAGERALRGADAVAAAWRPFFDGAVAPFSWSPDQVQVAESGRLALSTGPVTAADGSAAGRFNSVWRLDPDGVWRVVFDKGSD